jgi:hypothetical protein
VAIKEIEGVFGKIHLIFPSYILGKIIALFFILKFVHTLFLQRI